MDWPKNDACLGDSSADLERVFRYDLRPARVIKVASSNGYRAQVWSLRTHKDWDNWLTEQVDQTGEGLILILANRSDNGPSHCVSHEPISLRQWLAVADVASSCKDGIRREVTFAPLGEQSSFESVGREASLPPISNARSLRHLPFEQRTFRRICERFQIHDSFVRTVTRSDVPIFSCDETKMKGEQALVYNCRTPNSWELDLALSATHYPKRGLTLGIMYGTTNAIEKTILGKLESITGEAAHPLLLPGMLAELELARHIQLVENNINEVESKIFELNFASSRAKDYCRSEIERRSELKRTAWLDLSYLRNFLMTWNTQLLKMVEHEKWLTRAIYTVTPAQNVASSRSPAVIAETKDLVGEWDTVAEDIEEEETDEKEEVPSANFEKASEIPVSQESPFHDHMLPPYQDSEHSESSEDSSTTLIPVEEDIRAPSKLRESHATWEFAEEARTEPSERGAQELIYPERARETYAKQMCETGEKISVRLAAIRDEYDEKIRDCTMRVEGMAMATQWSQSETAVEIAVATNRDSAVMRSISLVTMIFLPGTFFATVFSMTFFNWSAETGKARVSSYLWIYVVVTVFFTAITIGLWYFFVMFNRKGLAKRDEERTRAK